VCGGNTNDIQNDYAAGRREHDAQWSPPHSLSAALFFLGGEFMTAAQKKRYQQAKRKKEAEYRREPRVYHDPRDLREVCGGGFHVAMKTNSD